MKKILLGLGIATLLIYACSRKMQSPAQADKTIPIANLAENRTDRSIKDIGEAALFKSVNALSASAPGKIYVAHARHATVREIVIR